MLIRTLSLEIGYDVVGLGLVEVEQTKECYIFKLRTDDDELSFVR
jgi:hypothetical protein